MGNVTFIKIRRDPPEGSILAFEGRQAWTLAALIDAGSKGITPIERPAPRWSQYVFLLRQAGLEIETVRQAHGGSYPGRHGRYVLWTPIEVLEIAGHRSDAA